MFRNIYFESAWLSIWIALSLTISGCSAVGLGIGASIDNTFPNSQVVSNQEIIPVKEGTAITINLKDGSQIRGTYQGLTEITNIKGHRKTSKSGALHRKIAGFDRTPFKRLVIVRTASGLQKISLDEIDTMIIPRKGNMKWIGLMVGMALDIVWISSLDVEVFGGDWNLDQ